MDAARLLERLEGLVIFRELLEVPVVSALRDALEAISLCDGTAQSRLLAVSAVARFESFLFKEGSCWSEVLADSAFGVDNPHVREYTRARARGEKSDFLICNATEADLSTLDELALVNLEALAEMAQSGSVSEDPGDPHRLLASSLRSLPSWSICEIDFRARYADRLTSIATTGYGIFSKHHVFTLQQGELAAVKHPDPIMLADLPGYEAERAKVIENTEALLCGKPACNVLLYGEAGTGKSSTVKAIVNEYAPMGLRLVEIRKSQLFDLPLLMDELADNPLKFIVFVDDLSFSAVDDNFAALKAILEGGAGGRASNAVVYATSNRRHLVKETAEDRVGTDIHELDTRQETMSLSARFGLIVTFSSPDRRRFAEILESLAAEAGLGIERDELVRRGEAFAIRAGGRSPRAARQFIDLLIAGVEV